MLVLQEESNKYIGSATSIIEALPPEEVPADLMDAYMFIKASDVCDGFFDELGEEDLRDAMGVVLGDAGIFGVPKVKDEPFVDEHHAIYTV